MKAIGVGLVGFGLGGRVFHAPFIEHTPGLALRAVVSSDAGKVQAHYPDLKVVPRVDALLADNSIELVVISSPDHLHAEHAIAVLEAGRHLLVDKPLATTLGDARLIAEAAARTGRMLTVFMNRRRDADFLTLRRLIDSGELGDIVHFESHFDRWRPEVGDVWKERRDGGSWQDLGPHLIDQAICLFGKPHAVTADIASMRKGATSPDWFHVILHYPAMRAVLHSTKLAADHGLRFAVHGTGASWIKHGMDTQESAIIAGMKPGDARLGIDPVPGLLTLAGKQGERREIPNERGSYTQFWRELAAMLRDECKNPVPASQALAVMEVLDAGLRSNESGSTIRL